MAQTLGASRAICMVGLMLGVAGCRASAGSVASVPVEGAQPVTVTMTEFRFSPEVVTVKARTSVALTAANKGVIEHNWVVRANDGPEPGTPIQVDARGGQTVTRAFTPPGAGTYSVVCTIPGHEQAGMVGTLRVE